jgi:hypothetical protein
LWVNQAGEARLEQGLWEPEPLRWLGVATGRSLMGLTDAAERRHSVLAPLLLGVMQRLFP